MSRAVELVVVVVGMLVAVAAPADLSATSDGALAHRTSAPARLPSISPPCDLYASPGGTDSHALLRARQRRRGAAPGSRRNPFASPQRLLRSLQAGRTGCLRQGTYSIGALRFAHGGRPGAPLTLRSYPGERATLYGGPVWVQSGADDVSIRDLNLVTTPSDQVGVQIMAADTWLIGDDITNQSAAHTCVILGSTAGWGTASRTIIAETVIHDCGSTADGNQDQGIYFSNSYDAVVTKDVLWGIAGYPIHLYENAQGTHVTHNVIDGGEYGVIFAGDGSYASSDNLVARNVITMTNPVLGVQSWWTGPIGSGNLLVDNCLFNGSANLIQTPATGFVALSNVIADPMFADRASHDYRLRPDSPCKRIVGFDAAVALLRRWNDERKVAQ